MPIIVRRCLFGVGAERPFAPGNGSCAGRSFIAGERLPPARPWPGMIAARLRALPRCTVLGRTIPVANGPRSRLLGLAGLTRAEAGNGLLIPRCASVHTFGMRFALDLIFLDREGRELAVRRGVPPRRLAWHRGAAAVVEVPAEGGEFGRPRDLGGRCCPSAKRSPASSSARTTR